jgi:PadR family transcriptional regulator PadR
MLQPTELLEGTLDLFILQTLSLEPIRFPLSQSEGWSVAQRVRQLSSELLRVAQASLFPALYRLEYKRRIRSEWWITESNRPRKFYLLTPKGKRRLEAEPATWDRLSAATGSLHCRVGEASS